MHSNTHKPSQIKHENCRTQLCESLGMIMSQIMCAEIRALHSSARKEPGLRRHEYSHRHIRCMCHRRTLTNNDNTHKKKASESTDLCIVTGSQGKDGNEMHFILGFFFVRQERARVSTRNTAAFALNSALASVFAPNSALAPLLIVH